MYLQIYFCTNSLDVRGQPQKSALCQPITRGRYESIRSHRLETGRRCPFRSASSTIEDCVTLDMTLTSFDAVNMVMLRSGVTAPTVADVTTVTKTEWL